MWTTWWQFIVATISSDWHWQLASSIGSTGSAEDPYFARILSSCNDDHCMLPICSRLATALAIPIVAPLALLESSHSCRSCNLLRPIDAATFALPHCHMPHAALCCRASNYLWVSTLTRPNLGLHKPLAISKELKKRHFGVIKARFEEVTTLGNPRKFGSADGTIDNIAGLL